MPAEGGEGRWIAWWSGAQAWTRQGHRGGHRAGPGARRRTPPGHRDLRHHHRRAGRPGGLAGQLRGEPGGHGVHLGVLEAHLLRPGRPVPVLAAERPAHAQRPGKKDRRRRLRLDRPAHRARAGPALVRPARPDPGAPGPHPGTARPRSRTGPGRSSAWTRSCRTPASSSPRWPPRPSESRPGSCWTPSWEGPTTRRSSPTLVGASPIQVSDVRSASPSLWFGDRRGARDGSLA
jgi:hypothetical protein